MTKVLKYCASDYIPGVPVWERLNKLSMSSFDRLLCDTWDEAEANGYFRYKLSHLQTKILPGKFIFVAQLNVRRAVERRQPQVISSISQPFNPSDFNFTKVGHNEILFEIQKMDAEPSKHLMIINVSPLEYGNSLLVPFVNLHLPQILTKESIMMAVEMILLSSTPAFRAGFNSLCANASVNHHHFHVFYLQHSLIVETLNVRRLIGDCYETIDYPGPGFVFQLNTKLSTVESLSDLVYKVSTYMQCNNIAHNLFITRGTTFESSDKSVYDAIRVYLWARKPVYGIKDDTAFNIACCELSGHLPIKFNDAFSTITEAEVCAKLQNSCEETFLTVRPEIIKLLTIENEV